MRALSMQPAFFILEVPEASSSDKSGQWDIVTGGEDPFFSVHRSPVAPTIRRNPA